MGKFGYQMKSRRPPKMGTPPSSIDLRIKVDGDVADALKARARAGDRPLMAEIRRAFKFYLENTEAA